MEACDEFSPIYYSSRGGLEGRATRVRSDTSAAAKIDAPICHMYSLLDLQPESEQINFKACV